MGLKSDLDSPLPGGDSSSFDETFLLETMVMYEPPEYSNPLAPEQESLLAGALLEADENDLNKFVQETSQWIDSLNAHPAFESKFGELFLEIIGAGNTFCHQISLLSDGYHQMEELSGSWETILTGTQQQDASRKTYIASMSALNQIIHQADHSGSASSLSSSLSSSGRHQHLEAVDRRHAAVSQAHAAVARLLKQAEPQLRQSVVAWRTAQISLRSQLHKLRSVFAEDSEALSLWGEFRVDGPLDPQDLAQEQEGLAKSSEQLSRMVHERVRAQEAVLARLSEYLTMTAKALRFLEWYLQQITEFMNWVVDEYRKNSQTLLEKHHRASECAVAILKRLVTITSNRLNKHSGEKEAIRKQLEELILHGSSKRRDAQEKLEKWEKKIEKNGPLLRDYKTQLQKLGATEDIPSTPTKKDGSFIFSLLTRLFHTSEKEKQ